MGSNGASQSRYQQGSIRKIKRASGFVWEWRYYVTTEEGKRQLKQRTFPGKLYPTERSVRLAIEPEVQKLNEAPTPYTKTYTFGDALDRYLTEDLSHLKHSTHATNTSLVELHLRPKWGQYPIQNITAMQVKTWLDVINLPAMVRNSGGFSS